MVAHVRICAGRAWDWLRRERLWILSAAPFLVVHLLWLSLDRIPPMWDQSWYLQGSEDLYRALTQGGLFGLIKAFTVVNGVKAPLLSLLPLPLYLVFGHSYKVALLVNLILILVGSYHLFRLAVRVRSARAGVLAVVFLNLFPLVAGLTREFLVETCLIVLVIIWHRYLFESDLLRAKGTWWKLGLVFGLGMLTKILFPLYVVGASIYVIWLRIREDRAIQRNLLATMIGAVATATAVASVWYARNMASAVNAGLSSGFGSVAGNYGSRDVLAWGSLSAFWLRVVTDVFSPILSIIVALAALALLLAEVRRGVGKGLATATDLRALWWWVLVPFVILSLGVNKDIRFLAPILPVVALLGAMGIDGLISARSRVSWLVPVALAAAGAAYLAGSFLPVSTGAGLPAFPRATVYPGTGGYVRAPIREVWPLETIREAIEIDAGAQRLSSPMVTLLFDHPRINANNMQYLEAYSDGGSLYTTGGEAMAERDVADREAFILSLSDYLVTKTGDLGPDFTNRVNRRISGRLDAGDLPYELIQQVSLPDDSTLGIYRRRS